MRQVMSYGCIDPAIRLLCHYEAGDVIRLHRSRYTAPLPLLGRSCHTAASIPLYGSAPIMRKAMSYGQIYPAIRLHWHYETGHVVRLHRSHYTAPLPL